jgi:hypothetical protein
MDHSGVCISVDDSLWRKGFLVFKHSSVYIDTDLLRLCKVLRDNARLSGTCLDTLSMSRSGLGQRTESGDRRWDGNFSRHNRVALHEPLIQQRANMLARKHLLRRTALDTLVALRLTKTPTISFRSGHSSPFGSGCPVSSPIGNSWSSPKPSATRRNEPHLSKRTASSKPALNIPTTGGPQAPLEYCSSLVQRLDPEAWLCSYFWPRRERAWWLAWRAFNVCRSCSPRCDREGRGMYDD